MTADQFNSYAMPVIVRAAKGLGQAPDNTNQPQAGIFIPGTYLMGAGVLTLLYFMWRDSKFNK